MKRVVLIVADVQSYGQFIRPLTTPHLAFSLKLENNIQAILVY
jgi:hypothetical protein